MKIVSASSNFNKFQQAQPHMFQKLNKKHFQGQNSYQAHSCAKLMFRVTHLYLFQHIHTSNNTYTL